MERSGFQLPFNPVTGAVLDDQEIPIQIHKSRFSAFRLAALQFRRDLLESGAGAWASGGTAGHLGRGCRIDKLHTACMRAVQNCS